MVAEEHGKLRGAELRAACRRAARRRLRCRLLPLLLLIALLPAATAAAQDTSPVWDIWYGDVQSFGALGNPQVWVNVLGNVQDADGLQSLEFTLNGGPSQALTIGPTPRRVARPGDFNVEIPITDLQPGPNTIVLQALDALGYTASKTVTLDYTAGNVWPGSFTTEWATAASISDDAQVVDGKWELTPDGLHIAEWGYDRNLAIGDLEWDDYEISVPITVHAIDPTAFELPLSVAPSLAILLRWTGHTELVAGEQPHQFWEPHGAGAWYVYDAEQYSVAGDQGLFDALPQAPPALDQTHLWKLRVEGLPSGETWYAFKFWPEGEAEPVQWMLSGTEPVDDVPSGSALLLAHHVDLTYGDIQTQDLATETEPPAILDPLVIATSASSVQLRWSTDEYATSEVAWGETSAYELGVAGSAGSYARAHTVTVNGLAPGVPYHFEIRSADQRGNVGTLPLVFSTADPGDPPPDSSLVSDDFSGAAPDPAWTFRDPVGDSSFAMTGVQLALTPGTDATHDIWTAGAEVPALVQSMLDEDFEVEAKWESPLSTTFQSQGILVEQDADDVLRIELAHIADSPRLFVAAIVGGNPTPIANQVLPSGSAPMWLRVRRIGDDFTVRYSFDGVGFVDGARFALPMAVSKVGVYAGNDAGTAHTSAVDYVFDTAAPIDPEDGGGGTAALDVTMQGSGSVARDPDLSSYALGSSVTLTATPEAGWVFDHWEGDLSASQNPESVTLDADTSVTAVFVSDGSDVTPPTISNVQSVVGTTSATISWDTDEAASSAVDYGTVSGSLGLRVEDPTLVTSHALALEGLSPDTTYFFQVESVDLSGNAATSGELGFTTAAEDTGAGIESDDFSGAALDPARWTFVDPLGDATAALNGTQLVLDVAANPEAHDFWTSANNLPRLLQTVSDGDFQAVTKFDSALDGSDFRSVGIVVLESELDGVRIEFHRLQGELKLFAASLFGGSATTHLSQPVSVGVPRYLRVTRAGDTFGVDYSSDGTSWTAGTSFTQPMTVGQVGVYAGSGANTSHTALVDYFFDAASPIAPEDESPSALLISTEGEGTVARDPDQASYAEGEVVELTALPDPDWQFDAWTGDVSSTDNPLVVTVGASTQVTAVFSQLPTVPPVVSNVQVTPDWNSALVTWQTDEPATSTVRYGTQSGVYDYEASAPSLVTEHAVLLSGLAPGTDHFFEVESVDGDGNPTVEGEFVFTTLDDTSGIVSDDFTDAGLDTAVWTFEDPLGDASATLNGSQLVISMDGGPEAHDVWCCSNTLPRAMQSISDTDFQVTAKFDSHFPDEEFRSTGILVEETNADVLRIEFHRLSGSTKVFVASIFGGAVDVRASQEIAVGTPRHLRVTRLGDEFRVEYGGDGVSWTEAVSFTEPMTVTRIGPYAGSGADVPHTGLVDYFVSGSDPIPLPEPGWGLAPGVAVLALLARRRRARGDGAGGAR